MEHAQKKKTSKPYSPEFRERAVRLLLEHRDEYQSEAAALTAIAGKLGCSPDSLRVWVRQAQRDGGEQPGLTSADKARIKELEREVRELRQANEILKKASAYFCDGGARPPVSQVTAFIEEHRGQFGVEPMCKMLQIAQSTYYERRAIAHDPERASARAKSDADLCIKIDAAWKDNRKLYGARKIWHVLLRDNQDVARCTVERLMRELGLKGVLRGKKVITTNPDTSQPCPDDKVNRLFMADRPNKLWVSDFTYVQTWSGTVYVAFVIDVFARRIVGWRASTSMKTQFVLDALDQAIWQRKTPDNKSLVHHSDRGSQYLSIKYTERLAEAEIDLSVGTVGDAYDNALAECVIGLFKTEVINQIGPWKSMREVEWETLKWVDWYNNRRLLGPIGYIPPAEAEEAFYANLNSLDMVA
ncbi:MAG: IS3 family transposase [Alphaproteobacteria bacterium]|nr:IS3 family transposase [Alphaproteobacteria bacterium]MBU1571800.1 IS3 family transposase [Alphaproteobacteria bacterium]MBU2242816.1 IS3 family transposase [Alphaproteobacteria bacterium]